MSTNEQIAASANGQPVLIRTPSRLAGNGESKGFIHALPAWIVSGVIHAVLLSLFLLVTVNSATNAALTEQSVIETKIDDATTDANLTNEDIGNNPDLQTNYDLDRKAEVSVPGPVDANAAVGILNAPEGAPQTVAPPPGLGEGQGGGIELTGVTSGKGALQGIAGGYNGVYVPGGFTGRSGGTRERMVEQGGGNSKSEAAVARGLKWLSLHQADDGHWSLDGFHTHGKDANGRKIGNCGCQGRGTTSNDIAATGFGLLPFLAAGETHKPNPASRNNVHYNKNVELGLKYLMTKQNPGDGDLGGGMYSHGIAAIALCEAYGLTGDPMLKSHAQRAIDYIVRAQHAAGGWRYTPNTPGDTSVVGWQVMALKSGQMAGLSVPGATLKGAEKFLDSVQTSDGGGYGYTDNNATPTMSAVGLLCRQYLGWTPRNPGLLNGVARLKKTPPGALDSMYYYYYATQVMHHMGGESWTEWNTKMRDALIERQDTGNDLKHPHQLGSWNPARDAHGGVGGRVMLTSLSTLTLEVYYRHLPLYRREMGGAKEMAAK
jgi:hypothetical protein